MKRIIIPFQMQYFEEHHRAEFTHDSNRLNELYVDIVVQFLDQLIKNNYTSPALITRNGLAQLNHGYIKYLPGILFI